MSIVTRIKRPTYATPRKAPTGRFVHVSTDYRWIERYPGYLGGPADFVKVTKGSTYRRPA